MMEKEFIQQARQADIAGYLLSINEPLIKNGHRYKHKEHDSLVFTKNAYFWNSRQEHGNAVDYLTRHKNMSFAEAVTALIGFTPSADPEMTTQLKDLDISNDYKRAIAYLHKARGICYSIIRNLIDTKHLYQEQKTNNILFPIYDESGQYVGAELQGTLSEKRFKGIRAGSKYGYGFNIRYGNHFQYALFFESAVDLLSFVDLKEDYEKKSLEHCILVSMSGLKVNILQHTLKAFQGNLKPVLCVDNDKAGQEFKHALERQKIVFQECRVKEQFKDWNEQLKCILG